MQPGATVISENGSDSNWLGIAKSLGRKGINVTRLTPKGWYNSKYCTSIISPNIVEKPEEFIKFLIKYGKKRKERQGCKDVLFPSSDNSLIQVSKNKKTLKPRL